MALLALLAAVAFSALAQNARLEIAGPSKTVTLSVRELQARLKVHTVKLDAPLAKGEKSYDAFALEDVLALAADPAAGAHDEIIFTSADGYAPNLNPELLKAHKGYLAFQEHGRKYAFEKVAQGKAMVSPGPFYLLWAEGRAVARELPWPYQLTKVELVSFAKKFPHLYPQGAAAGSAEFKGFLTFKERCVRCHSINLEGGDVGPELNTPKNVTEYWKPDVLKEFIRHPSRFRARSKMPDSPDFTDEQIENVIAYLKRMKGA